MTNAFSDTPHAGFDGKVWFRCMDARDLDLVEHWLFQPHVTRWWERPSDELASIRRRILDGIDVQTHMLIVSLRDVPIGFAQWYRWEDYPDEARAMDTLTGEIGIDYAIGDPSAIGRGVGRRMISALIRYVRREQPGAGMRVGAAAANYPSRAVLERNRFQLVAVRSVVTEPRNDPIAIYRLAPQVVRLATIADADVVGCLLDRFNREFDEPTPGPEALSARMTQLIELSDTDVILGGAGPDGLAVLRFRPSIWTEGNECYVAELYVTEAQRGAGLGRAVMRTAIDRARRRKADWMHIEVDEPDLAARHLYESLGFSNHAGGPDGPLMHVYERDLE